MLPPTYNLSLGYEFQIPFSKGVFQVYTTAFERPNISGKNQFITKSTHTKTSVRLYILCEYLFTKPREKQE